MSREEDAYVIERMGKLLAEIAIIVNGTEPHDTLWSYHDLPEKVRALKQAPPAAAVPDVRRDPVYIGMRNRLTSELVRQFVHDEYEVARAKAEALVNEYESALEAALENSNAHR